MTIHCERCGKEINLEDAYKVTMAKRNRVESRTLCEDCKLLSESFMTAAYIPGISQTQYDILVRLSKNEEMKSNSDAIKEIVKELREKDMTVPEIVREIGICNQCVMKILKS